MQTILAILFLAGEFAIGILAWKIDRYDSKTHPKDKEHTGLLFFIILTVFWASLCLLWFIMSLLGLLTGISSFLFSALALLVIGFILCIALGAS